jgi:hypothetical protein
MDTKIPVVLRFFFSLHPPLTLFETLPLLYPLQIFISKEHSKSSPTYGNPGPVYDSASAIGKQVRVDSQQKCLTTQFTNALVKTSIKWRMQKRCC